MALSLYNACLKSARLSYRCRRLRGLSLSWSKLEGEDLCTPFPALEDRGGMFDLYISDSLLIEGSHQPYFEVGLKEMAFDSRNWYGANRNDGFSLIFQLYFLFFFSISL